MVFALYHMNLLVGKGVVRLMVVHIEQRCYLRESFREMLHEGIGLLLLFRCLDAELHQEHQLACVGCTDHQRAQQSTVFTQVIELQSVLQRIATDVVANLIVDVIHQMTLRDVENLVEGSCDVETHSVHHIILDILPHFLLG